MNFPDLRLYAVGGDSDCSREGLPDASESGGVVQSRNVEVERLGVDLMPHCLRNAKFRRQARLGFAEPWWFSGVRLSMRRGR